MKKYLMIAITVLCMLALAACSKDDGKDTTDTGTTKAPAATLTETPATNPDAALTTAPDTDPDTALTTAPANTSTSAPTETPDSVDAETSDETPDEKKTFSTAEISTEQIAAGAVEVPEVSHSGQYTYQGAEEPQTGDGEPKTGDADPDIYPTLVPSELIKYNYELKDADILKAAYNEYIDLYCSENPDAQNTLGLLTIDMENDGHPEIIMAPDSDRDEYIILKYDIESNTVLSFGPYTSNEGLLFFIGSTIFIAADEDDEANEAGTVYTITDNRPEVIADIFVNLLNGTTLINGEDSSEEECVEMIYGAVIEQTGITDTDELERLTALVELCDLYDLTSYHGEITELLDDLFKYVNVFM